MERERFLFHCILLLCLISEIKKEKNSDGNLKSWVWIYYLYFCAHCASDIFIFLSIWWEAYSMQNVINLQKMGSFLWTLRISFRIRIIFVYGVDDLWAYEIIWILFDGSFSARVLRIVSFAFRYFWMTPQPKIQGIIMFTN